MLRNEVLEKDMLQASNKDLDNSNIEMCKTFVDFEEEIDKLKASKLFSILCVLTRHVI